MEHEENSKETKPKSKGLKTPPKVSFWYLFLILWLGVMAYQLYDQRDLREIPYSQFQVLLEGQRVTDLNVTENRIEGKIKDAKPDEPARFFTIRVDTKLAEDLTKHAVSFKGVIESTFLKDIILNWIIPLVLFFGLWMYLMRRSADKQGFGGGGFMGVGKARAKVYVEEKIKNSFADVAGVDEAKEELQEIIEFLRNPERYGRLGGRLPKGILLVGPPGTGKTLLARAVAGEAKVPFFFISGSEFVEMFVGVGAARVRDLFEQAQKKAPCIIFIDELDALGRARGINPIVGGGHDEKEQTLNQLLVEMDGFDPRQGVVLLAATNRPEILDPALLRAGRFDRQVLVDRPDKKSREQILAVHMKRVKLSPDVEVEKIASLTPGFTGADLANLINEAALLATRRKADSVTMEDFNNAVERLIAGLEKRNRVLNPHERKVVAYHEMGHALVALALPGADPVHKVSIIPRGIGALGYTIQRPLEDRFLMTAQELQNKMAVLLGGRAAEQIVFGESSTGATDDLSRATELARGMVTRFGMGSKELGMVAYETDNRSFLGTPYEGAFGGSRRYSEETAREIDCEVRNLVQGALEKATKILEKNRQHLVETSEKLLVKETLLAVDLPAIEAAEAPSAAFEAHKNQVVNG